MYNAYVLPVLMYNSGALGTPRVGMDAMDIAHRKQLRQLLRVHYPAIISNKKLYSRCKVEPISLSVCQQRWRLFGHILRYPVEQRVWAQWVMYYYFICGENYRHFRGRKLTLPVVLDSDLRRVQGSLVSVGDLERLRVMAQNRTQRKLLTRRVVGTLSQQQWKRQLKKRKRRDSNKQSIECVNPAKRRVKVRAVVQHK
jgi:hypothetical protein